VRRQALRRSSCCCVSRLGAAAFAHAAAERTKSPPPTGTEAGSSLVTGSGLGGAYGRAGSGQTRSPAICSREIRKKTYPARRRPGSSGRGRNRQVGPVGTTSVSRCV
jgi:hypothetical protein